MSNLNNKLKSLHIATKSIVKEDKVSESVKDTFSESYINASKTPSGMSSLGVVGLFTPDKDNFISNGKLDSDDLRRLQNIYTSIISKDSRDSVINQFSQLDKPNATEFEEFAGMRLKGDLETAYGELIRNMHRRNRDSQIISNDSIKGAEIISECKNTEFTVATFRDTEGNSARVIKRMVDGKPKVVFDGLIEAKNVIGLGFGKTQNITMASNQPIGQSEGDWWYETI